MKRIKGFFWIVFVGTAVFFLSGCGKPITIRTEHLTIVVDPNRIEFGLGDLLLRSGPQGTDMIAGASSVARTFTLPVGPADSYTNPYLILWDIGTGDMVTAATGVVSSTVAWTSCDIAGTLHSGTGSQTNTFTYCFSIPALDERYTYGMGVFDNATPANTDLMITGPMLYDPRTGRTYTDASPIYGGAVLTLPAGSVP